MVDLKGSMTIIDCLNLKGSVLIRKALLTLRTIYVSRVVKANELIDSLKEKLARHEFSKATALKVPNIQYQANVDHSEDKRDEAAIVLHANSNLLVVAIASAQKDLDFAILWNY